MGLRSLRLGKNELHELCRVQLFKRFSAKFVKFSAKLGYFNLQIRNTFKNVIFIVYKRCKICKYQVNSMVISCSTCQKEEKACFYLFDLHSLWRLQICCNLRVFFRKICIPKILEFTKTSSFQEGLIRMRVFSKMLAEEHQ